MKRSLGGCGRAVGASVNGMDTGRLALSLRFGGATMLCWRCRRAVSGVGHMRHNLGSILRSSLLLAAVVLALGGCGQSFDDPATAQCAAPPVAFDQPVDKGTHREVVVHFTCEGAVLTGTLYLPNNGGRHPAVVWILGGQPGSDG